MADRTPRQFLFLHLVELTQKDGFLYIYLRAGQGKEVGKANLSGKEEG